MVFDPILAGASTVASTLFFFAAETRPSGLLSVEIDVDVYTKQSTIPGAGLGLFAARDLQAGTVLGQYPGRIWGADAWLRYKGLTPSEILLEPAERERVQRVRQRTAEVYTWKLGKGFDPDDPSDRQSLEVPLIDSLPGATPGTKTYTADIVIDPTSATGELADAVPWILNSVSMIPTILCRINEPGRGGDVNVVAEEGEDSVAFVLERGVKEGEELFLDYGPYYDRSKYGGEAKIKEAVRAVLDAALRDKEQAETSLTLPGVLH